MKRPDGTLTGVSQSIDTWSFGCVLSVAATWVVLGFQGVRQYEQLRQLSPSNTRSQEPQDRFHDGYQVLSEIRKWHDYLRGHLRPSDTVTDTVLDLIEHKLLQTDTSLRPDLEDLCNRLNKLSSRAEYEIRDLKKPSRDTDPVVLKALLKVEEEAQNQKSSERKTTPLLQQSIAVSGVNKINPRQRASMQIQKSRIIKSKPLGQTAYRKEILESELKTSSIIKEDDERSIGGTHNGATTDSPVDSTPPLEETRFDRLATPRNPEFQDIGRLESSAGNAAKPPTNTPAPRFSSTSPPHTPTAAVAVAGHHWRPGSSQSTKRKQNIRNHDNNASGSAYPSPTDSHLDEKHVYGSDNGHPAPSPGPLITLSEPAEPVASSKPICVTHLDADSMEKETVGESHDFGSSMVRDPFDICWKRKELDQDVSKGFAKLKGKFGIETRARDASLEETYQRRELVSVSFIL
jgi:hypothetical protein